MVEASGVSPDRYGRAFYRQSRGDACGIPEKQGTHGTKPMKTQQAIWFVIVTYEPERETLRRLVAALEGWLVMIVDNTQNQLQTLNFKLQNEKANVAYIHTGKNLGYATAGNQGMKAAFDKGAQWVVVCNQDIAL